MSAAPGVFLPGVEVPLPDDERVLWQGGPARALLTRHAFHARKIVAYFAALLAIAVLFALDEPSPAHALLVSGTSLAVSAVAATAFAGLLALLTARTTVYAITERRVVLKIGIALPVVLNVPLRLIESVAFTRRADGTGDLALHLAGDVRVAYLVLWPHARPWRIRHPEPLLRALSDVDAVGAVLRDALLAQARAAAVESEPDAHAAPTRIEAAA